MKAFLLPSAASILIAFPSLALSQKTLPIVDCVGIETRNAIYAGIIPPPPSGRIKRNIHFTIERDGEYLKINGLNLQHSKFKITRMSDDRVSVLFFDKEQDEWMLELDRNNGNFQLFESAVNSISKTRDVKIMIQASCSKKERLL
jgi:hypothetical protein